MKKTILNLSLACAGALVASGCATAHHPTTADDKGNNHKGAPIVYFELAGADGQKLKEFYATVFGWKIDANASIAATSTGGIKGGIRQDPPEKIFYLGVPDIVAALKQIEAAGGKTVVRRTVVPGVVTFALFTDPAGNRMGLAELGSYPP
jgi:predicted enzyme related to lactoylglutathione lyase